MNSDDASNCKNPRGLRSIPSLCGWLFGALLLIAAVGSVVLQLGPGNTDDKTLLFATSNVRFFDGDTYNTVKSMQSEVPGYCKTERCRWRTSERLSSLYNYYMTSVTMEAVGTMLLPFDMPKCKWVSETYSLNFLFQHLLALTAVVVFVWRERIWEDGRFMATGLVVMLCSPAFVVAQTIPLSWILPLPADNDGIFIYVPRGVLGWVFLLQCIGYLRERRFLFLTSCALAPAVHLVQGIVLLVLWTGVFVFRLVFSRHELRTLYKDVGILVCALALSLSVYFLTAAGIQIPVTMSPYLSFSPQVCFQMSVIFVIWAWSTVRYRMNRTDEAFKWWTMATALTMSLLFFFVLNGFFFTDRQRGVGQLYARFLSVTYPAFLLVSMDCLAGICKSVETRARGFVPRWIRVCRWPLALGVVILLGAFGIDSKISTLKTNIAVMSTDLCTHKDGSFAAPILAGIPQGDWDPDHEVRFHLRLYKALEK